ncbi:MAG TPA: Maf family protein, partial [Sphingomicrobium sp.]|nr:Maf family protein [Sphingomicrobium sp.]
MWISWRRALGGCRVETVPEPALRLRDRFSTRLSMALVLASSSAIRSAMLAQAGVDFEAVPAGVDEAREKARHVDAGALASALGRAKALK